MRIIGNLGYRELEKLGGILQELGKNGNVKGIALSIDTLTVEYDSHGDKLILDDNNNKVRFYINDIEED